MIALISISVLITVFVTIYLFFGSYITIPDFCYSGIDYFFNYAGQGVKLVSWIFPSQAIMNACVLAFVVCFGACVLWRVFRSLMTFIQAFKLG